jgi:hypothetical protein
LFVALFKTLQHLANFMLCWPCFTISGINRFFFGGGGGSTNSVEDRGHREKGSGGGSPLVRGSAKFANG